MKAFQLLFITGIATLAGCAVGPTPQNPQEFREAIKKGSFGTFSESYQVSNSHSKVAATLKSKANECLNRTITMQECRSTGMGAPSCFNRQYTLIPKVTTKGKSTEMTVRFKTNHGNVKEVYLGGPPPEGGAYAAVIDAIDAGGGKTQVDVYGAQYSFFAHIPKAVKHWTEGTNLGCPDFSADI